MQLTNLGRDLRIDWLIGCRKNAELDKISHDVELLQSEAGCQLWNEYRWFDSDEFRIIEWILERQRQMRLCLRSAFGRRYSDGIYRGRTLEGIADWLRRFNVSRWGKAVRISRDH